MHPVPLRGATPRRSRPRRESRKDGGHDSGIPAYEIEEAAAACEVRDPFRLRIGAPGGGKFLDVQPEATEPSARVAHRGGGIVPRGRCRDHERGSIRGGGHEHLVLRLVPVLQFLAADEGERPGLGAQRGRHVRGAGAGRPWR
jgi:hypothetical protein